MLLTLYVAITLIGGIMAIYRGSVFGYASFDEASTRLDQLVSEHPSTFRKQLVGQSIENRPINAYVIQQSLHSVEDKPYTSVLLTSLIHAREPAGLAVLLHFAARILEEIALLPPDIAVYLVPFMNPDGYVEIERTNNQNIRKNRRNSGKCSRDQDEGVDLNRNFAYQWKHIADPCHEEYAGAAPFSEPETQALKQLVESVDFAVALNFHTYGEVLTHPWNYDKGATLPASDAQIYRLFDDQLNFSKFGSAPSIFGYSAPGESDDWLYGVHGVISMSPEIGPEKAGFFAPITDIDAICATNFERIMTAIRIAKVTLQVTVPSEVQGVIRIQNHGLAPFKQDIWIAEQYESPGACDGTNSAQSARLSGGWIARKLHLEIPKSGNVAISHVCNVPSQVCVLSILVGCTCDQEDTSGCDRLKDWADFKDNSPEDAPSEKMVHQSSTGTESQEQGTVLNLVDIPLLLLAVVSTGAVIYRVLMRQNPSVAYSRLRPTVLGLSQSV